MGKKQLEDFIKYMKEKCEMTESLKIEESYEGHRQMYKVVFPDNMSEKAKTAWNYFIQEADEQIKKDKNYQHLLIEANEYGILHWTINSGEVDYYFIYKIHITVIDKFLQEETHEKIMKGFAPRNNYGCY